MKIAAIQMDIAWADPTANRARAEASFAALPSDVALIVLPEMFSTGFATQPEGIAEVEPYATLEWMRTQASRRGCAIAGSIAVAVGKGAVGVTYRNRFYFVTPDGIASYYDKHHIFSYGGEDCYYDAGNERVVVEWQGVRFLLMVCYDLRFPCWSRNRADYDCALYVASWPTSRIGAWQTLLRARAIENQCYVVGVNRVGEDPVCSYCGCSAIIDAYGRDIAASATGGECCIVADLDLDALKAFRRKFPVLNDRDRTW